MKRQRPGQCFLPQAFETKAVAKKKLQDEVNAAFERIEKLQLATMVDMEIEMSETQALVLISTKVSFIALMYLKLLSAHIPASYTMIPSGSEVPLRLIFISDILKQQGFTVSPSESMSYIQFLEDYCPEFMESPLDLTTSLWCLTHTGRYRYNRFLSPPTRHCLSCESALSMHIISPIKL